MIEQKTEPQTGSESATPTTPAGEQPQKEAPREIGGRKGPEPTRYGDWEKGGICSDF